MYLRLQQSGVYDDTRHTFIYGEETLILNKVSQVCYEQSLDLRLAQAGAVGHDVAARCAVEAGQGLGQCVRGGGDHRGGGQPVQQELALALLRICIKLFFGGSLRILQIILPTSLNPGARLELSSSAPSVIG